MGLYSSKPSLPETSVSAKEREANPRWYLLRKGPMAATPEFRNFLDVSTFLLMRSESQQFDGEVLKKQMEQAWKQFLEKYPILVGKLHCLSTPEGTEWWTEAPETTENDTVHVEDWSQDKSIDLLSMTRQEIFDWINEKWLKSRPASKNSQDRVDNPDAPDIALSSITMLLLPDGFWAYQISVGHALVDGFSYYRLVEAFVRELNTILDPKEGKKVAKEFKPLTFDEPKVLDHSIYEKQDFWIMTVLAGLGWLHSIAWSYFFPKPPAQMVVFDDAKLSKAKEKLCDKSQVPFLSSNDIITAAILRAVPSFISLLIFSRSDRKKTVEDHLAGLYITQISVPAQEAKDPTRFRTILKEGRYFNSKFTAASIPKFQVLYGRNMAWTSWATCQGSANTMKVAPSGHQWILQVPNTNAVHQTPIDVVIPFWLAPGRLAVLHNLSLPPSPSLKDETEADYDSTPSSLLHSIQSDEGVETLGSILS